MPGTGLANVLYWIGLSLVGVSALCIAVIGLRTSGWLGPKRSALSELGRFDIKLAKIGGVLFVIGALVFLVTFIVE